MAEDARQKAGWHCADAIRAVWGAEEQVEHAAGMVKMLGPQEAGRALDRLPEDVDRLEDAVLFAASACNLSRDEIQQEFDPLFQRAKREVNGRNVEALPSTLERHVLRRFRDILHDHITVLELKEG